MLAQNKFEELLATLKPQGQDPALDAAILVSRGYAEIGLKHPEDAQKSFAEAEQVAPNAVEPLLADARLAIARADLAGLRRRSTGRSRRSPNPPKRCWRRRSCCASRTTCPAPSPCSMN